MLGYENLSLVAVNASTRETIRQLHTQETRPVSIANGVWVRTSTGPKPEYVKTVQDYFAAESKGFTDPDAANAEINQFVSKNTEGEIKKLFEALPSETVFVLVNTVLFKGKWETPFDPKRTQPRDFTLANGDTIQVPTMMSDDLKAEYYAGDAFTALRLPYKEGFSMLLLLPNHGTAASLIHSLEDVQAELQGKMAETNRLSVTLPKFEAEHDIDLTRVLREMGGDFLFTSPDLSGIVEGAFVSDALQKCVIRVDEEGTVAAAATGVVGATSMPPTFWANRPFAYVIEGHGVNLFVGVCADPRG